MGDLRRGVMTETSGFTSIDNLAVDLGSRIDVVQNLLHDSRGVLGSEYQNDCDYVQSCIDEARRELASPNPVSVALLGSTGAGKSTLINSIIGSQILPTSSLAVCTSSITRVRFKPGTNYSAEVELVPFESWEKQLEQAAAEIRASKEIDEDVAAYVSTSPIPEDEAKRIRAIYGPEQFDKFMQSGNRSDLIEPKEVTKAFSDVTIKFTRSTSDELRQEVGMYLTSKGVFWPIVRTCLIEGPFESMNHGSELVDLPGLNDPNEAREQLTRTFLETSKFVWVVFNMKRSLGKDLTQVLESRDLIGRLLVGGRLSTLTFVGTHSDDVSSVNPEDFGLDEDASASEIALARNEQAEVELRSNLQNVARSYSPGGQQSASTAELTELLVKSPVYMVSASNHLQLTGNGKSKVAVIFEDPYETNVPQLSQHLRRVSVEAGPRANAYAVVSALEELISDLATSAQSEKTRQILRAEQSELAKSGLFEVIENSSQTLITDSSNSVNRLGRSLQEAIARFKSSSAIDKAVVDKIVAQKISTWQGRHHMTIRATAVRGGRFFSASAGEIDIIQDLSAPVISKAMDPWKAFFEKDLSSLTQQTADQLRSAVDFYGQSLSKAGENSEILKPILANLLPDLTADVSDSIEAALAVAQKKLNAELEQRQQELHAVTENAIAAEMNGVFARAASESGPGMKSRMISILEAGARNAVPMAIDQIQIKLADITELAVAAVLDGINPVVQRIAEKSSRISELLTENSSELSSASIEDIDGLLAKVTVARSFVSKNLNFDKPIVVESGLPISAIESTELATESSYPILIDASNVARSSGVTPNIELLELCRIEAEKFFQGHKIVLVADASLPRIVENQSGAEQVELLNQMKNSEKLTVVPPGSHGKADKWILNTAASTNGVVVSNDSFKEFQSDYPFLFEEGRLFGHTYHSALGWQFTQRFPVRPRSY